MSGIEPELWVGRAASAVGFYEAAFGPRTLLRVGEGEDVVARLEVGGARFWVASADGDTRLDPLTAGGRTGRTLLVVDGPDAVVTTATGAGATLTSPVAGPRSRFASFCRPPSSSERPIGARPA